jgi:serine/threonine-protein kinase RsbW
MITFYDKKVQIDSTNNPEGTVEHLVVDVCEQMHIGEEKFGNILLAVTEAVDNAIIHGNKNNPNKKVELGYLSSKQDITFAITDEGEGFNINTITDPTTPENSESIGRGIFIMKALSDKLEFLSKEKTVLLSFNLN